jgi:hypothetical protein
MHRPMPALVALAALFASAPVRSHEHPAAPATPQNPAWVRMKTLAGAWEGTYEEEGTKKASTTSFRMVSGGSAILNTLAEGTPHEMVTMFHMDLGDLIATHYCAAQNQPRFKAVPSQSTDRITFEFKDGTNIAPGDGYMHRVVFTFDGPDHHTEDWTFLENGKESTAHFDFHRRK